MRRLSGLLLVIGTLSGCASQSHTDSPWLIKRELAQPQACAPLTSDQELAVNVAQEMFDAGRLHAALANLERLPESLPEARLRKARILRLLGRSEAEALYRKLLGSCLVAEAHHGIGQLEASRRRYPEALDHFKKAVGLAPTNEAMRNDLGVVYLNLRKLPEARFELMTALELKESDNHAAENLLTLLVYENRWSQAGDLVTRRKLTPAQFHEAERRAQLLRSEDRSTTGESAGPLAGAEVERKEATRPAAPTVVPVPVQVAVPAQSLAAPASGMAVQKQSEPASTASRQTSPAPLAPARPAPQPAAATSGTGGSRGVQRIESADSRPVVPIAGIEEEAVTR